MRFKFIVALSLLSGVFLLNLPVLSMDDKEDTRPGITQRRLERQEIGKGFINLGFMVTTTEAANLLYDGTDPTSEKGRLQLYEWGYIIENEAAQGRLEEEYKKKDRYKKFEEFISQKDVSISSGFVMEGLFT